MKKLGDLGKIRYLIEKKIGADLISNPHLRSQL